MSDHNNISVGLGVFADYVNVTGAKRVTIIDQQTARYTDATRLAWYPYQVAEAGIKAAMTGNVEAAMARMLSRAPKSMVSHYEEIAAGVRKFVRANCPTLVPVKGASWTAPGLTVNVRHHVGLRLPTSRTVIAFLYLKQAPLTNDGRKAVWRILESTGQELLPEAEVAVLDVRRARLLTPPKLNRDKLDRWLNAEAAGYVAHWQSAVA